MKFEIDAEDFLKVNQFNWYGTPKNYINAVDLEYNTLQLGRFLLNAEITDKRFVDHIDRDPSNNKKSNLRFATVMQNSVNKYINYGSSKFKGVSCKNGSKKWCARLCYNYKVMHLYFSNNEVHCAYAYDIGATIAAKEFAYLNKVDMMIPLISRDIIFNIVKNKMLSFGYAYK